MTPPQPFFGFPPLPRNDIVPTLSDTTRQLCCAAYVDPDFASAAIREVVEDEHRAVPPSFGFDLEAVLRHSYRARRMLLRRHLALALLLLVGLVLVPEFTAAWLLLGGAVVLWRWYRRFSRGWPADRASAGARSRARSWAPIAVTAAVLVLCCPVGLTLAPALFSSSSSSNSGSGGLFAGSGGGLNDTGGLGNYRGSNPYGSQPDWVERMATHWYGSLTLQVWVTLMLAALTFVTLMLFYLTTYQTLTRELAPSQRVPLPELPNERIARRVTTVSVAQRGNITLQRSNPFIGCGEPTRGWSFALALRPAEPDDAQLAGRLARAGVDPDVTSRVDPIELNNRIKTALEGLANRTLPETARVPGVVLLPHIVADGVRRLDDPLIEPHSRAPYATASTEAIDAIIRSPQGGLRYYQRAVLGYAGRAVRTSDDRQVLPAQSQEILISVFVHAAVEGGMLYAEFISTVLAPVDDRYHLLDAMHSDAGSLLRRAAGNALRGWLLDSVTAPWRALRSGWHMLTGGQRMDRADRDSREFRAYDYGARVSVRELAIPPVDERYRFLDRLDAEKYVKLAQRVVNMALVEYLDECGADTGELAQRIRFVQNNTSNIISGGNFFNSAFGTGAAGTANG